MRNPRTHPERDDILVLSGEIVLVHYVDMPRNEITLWGFGSDYSQPQPLGAFLIGATDAAVLMPREIAVAEIIRDVMLGGETPDLDQDMRAMLFRRLGNVGVDVNKTLELLGYSP